MLSRLNELDMYGLLKMNNQVVIQFLKKSTQIPAETEDLWNLCRAELWLFVGYKKMNQHTRQAQPSQWLNVPCLYDILNLL